ncbi:hypothetical protein GGF31_004107 [Allomyces arbusculus]|nr:hypothetical protein GGF31_004107 [Allomyces arbusculus]
MILTHPLRQVGRAASARVAHTLAIRTKATAASVEPKSWDAIPRLSPTLPFVGSALKLAMVEPRNTAVNMHRIIRELVAEYGPIMRLRMPGADQDSIITADADMTADVFRADGPTPERMAPPTWDYFRKRNDLPAGIVMEQGDEWKRLRSAIQSPIFPPKSAHAFCSKVDQITAQAMDVMERELRRAGPEVLEGKKTVALEDLVVRWSIESVSKIVLGQTLGALNDPPNPVAREMVDAFYGVLSTTTPVLLHPEFAWRMELTPAVRTHFKAMQASMDLTAKFMATTFTECAADPSKLDGTFLGHVLRRDATLTRDEMLASAVDILMAGFDTTKYAVLFTLNLLGRHPNVQAKLRDEIVAVVGADPSAPVTEAHLAQFKYLKNVIKESLRVYSIAPVLSRFAPCDTVVGGYAVPKGTEILMAMEVTSRSDRYFTNPDEFVPERWDGKDVHPFASLPFSFGSRSCVGRRLAEMEMTVFLAHFLRRFEILPAPAPDKIVFNMVLMNEDPIPLQLRPLAAL